MTLGSWCRRRVAVEVVAAVYNLGKDNTLGRCWWPSSRRRRIPCVIERVKTLDKVPAVVEGCRSPLRAAERAGADLDAVPSSKSTVPVLCVPCNPADTAATVAVNVTDFDRTRWGWHW